MQGDSETGGTNDGCESCGAPRGTPHRGWCTADVTDHNLEGTVTIEMETDG